jgi:hypothetical protein
MILKRGNKGQVTIFIILAILIVAIVALIFILINREGKPEGPSSVTGAFSPESFLTTCIEKDAEFNTDKLSQQGGYSENSLVLDFEREGEMFYNISYLCYTSENGEPCVVQQPSVINNMERGIESVLTEEVSGCFNSLISSYTNDGFEASGDYNGFSIDLISGRMVFEIDSTISASKGEANFYTDNVTFDIRSDIYELGKISQRIIKEESESGSFDRLSYLLIHPGYSINMEKIGSSKVYFVESKNTNELFVFAVRGGF